MKAAETRRTLAAIDLDGTLFGQTPTVSRVNRAALDRLVAEGFHVVLASGRHPQDMIGIAERLPMVEWIVAGQGCEVADSRRQVVLSRSFLNPADVGALIMGGAERGFGVVAYTEAGEATPVEHPEVERCRRVSHTQISVDPGLAARPLFKLMWIAAENRIDELVASRGSLPLSADLDTVRSHPYVFEFVPRGVSKGSGVATLAARLGVSAEQVVAFGDADNDVPLFDWAGRSVAMPHASAFVRSRATHVAPPGPQESAFARAVELVMDGRIQATAVA